jgi:hypothetical protein
LKTVLEGRRHDYYSIVLKASEILDEDDLCKMAVLVTAIVKYRKGRIDPVIVDFAVNCLNKYPNLIHAFTRIGVSPPDVARDTKESMAIAGDDNKESAN